MPPRNLQLQAADQAKYAELEFFGSGAEAVVYSAVYLPTGDPVAIKILQPTPAGPVAQERRRKRFLREAGVLRRVSHPNIARAYEILDVVLDGSATKAFTMEWLPGNLAKFIAAHPNGLDAATLTRYFRATLEGVGFLHSQDIAIRDIRPENLLLDEGGALHVADLGMARTGDGGGSLTDSSRYMAPEVLNGGIREGGGGDPEPRDYFPSDIYALGFIFYEAAVGPAAWERIPALAPVYASSGWSNAHDNRRRWEEWHLDERTSLPPLSSLRSDLDEALVSTVDAMILKSRSGRIHRVGDALGRLFPAHRPAPAPIPVEVKPADDGNGTRDEPQGKDKPATGDEQPDKRPEPNRPFARVALVTLSLVTGGVIGLLASRLWQPLPNETSSEQAAPSIEPLIAPDPVGLLHVKNDSAREIVITWATAMYANSAGQTELFNSGYHGYPRWRIQPGETQALRLVRDGKVVWDGSFTLGALKVEYGANATYASITKSGTGDTLEIDLP